MLCQSPFSQLNSSQDCQSLYQFLEFCQEQAIATNRAKIASVSLETAPVDPLMVLHYFAAGQRHFYIENRDSGEAIAAFDPVVSKQISGSQRFVEAQQFTQDCFAQLLANQPAASGAAWAAPCLFSSFSFFDETSSAAPFAPATLFLPRWQVTRRQNSGQSSGQITVNWLIAPEANISEISQTIWQQLQKFSGFLPSISI